MKALPNGFLSVASQRSAALNQKLERLAFHLSCILVPPAREGKQTLSEDPFTIKIPPTSPQRAAVIDTFRSSFTIPILSCFTSASALDASIIFAGGQFIISTQLLNFVADIFREITQSLPTKYAVLRRRKRKKKKSDIHSPVLTHIRTVKPCPSSPSSIPSSSVVT